MNYLFPAHAREVLARQQIPPAWVELVLTSPEITEDDPLDPDLEHRLARIAKFDNRVLWTNTIRWPEPVSSVRTTAWISSTARSSR